MMPRGGRRPGAGRKPGRSFDDFTRMAFGSRCEGLWKQECEKAKKKAIEAATRNVGQTWAEMRVVPTSKRKRFSQSERFTDLRDDIEFALRESQRIDAKAEREPDRLVRIVPKRPKGVRARIIAQVATEETATRGVKVSQRMIETGWKEFRAMQRELEGEDD